VVIAKSSFKIQKYVTTLECVAINPEYGVNCHVFTVLFKIK